MSTTGTASILERYHDGTSADSTPYMPRPPPGKYLHTLTQNIIEEYTPLRHSSTAQNARIELIMSARMKINFQTAFSRLRSRRAGEENTLDPSSVNERLTVEGPTSCNEAGLTWKETYWRQGPLLGVTALVLAVGCTFAALAVLEASDGQPTADWKSNPVSFYLSISVTACNVLIRFGLASGLPILWWRHALQGRMIADLNREWEVGRSLLQALGSFRSMSLVMLATLSSAILILDGPLMQKASYPTLAVPTNPVSFAVRVAPQLPSDCAATVDRDIYG